jgi:hypothetical protein
MPYVTETDRRYVDAVLGNLLDCIKVRCFEAGHLNYLVTSLAAAYIEQHGKQYENINAAVGALECAKLELYRRVAAPYEDTKIAANGDVYPASIKT